MAGRLPVYARHIFGDETPPLHLLQIVEGIGVGFPARGGNGCTRLCGGNRKVAGAVGFTDASILLVEGEADCALCESRTEGVSDFVGGGGSGGVDGSHHRAGGKGVMRVATIAVYLNLARAKLRQIFGFSKFICTY